jgi:hypothetical protein
MRSPFIRIGHALERVPARWQFAVFLMMTVIATLTLTIVSYTLYLVSGTAQLDLSRPGYKQALSEVTPTDTNDYGYSPSGPLDAAALKEFKSKYDALTAKTQGYGAFDPGVLSDEQLNLTQSSIIGPQ